MKVKNNVNYTASDEAQNSESESMQTSDENKNKRNYVGRAQRKLGKHDGKTNV